jgi:osmoprotectant transport system ATP-binding protein
MQLIMIEVRHLSKRFGSLAAVDDISFQVRAGEIFVLLGTSGCGKTTTLKMINRLVAPDAGEIRIGGKPSTAEPVQKWRRAIGYVMQDIGLFPHYTVAENAAVVPDLLKWDKAKTRARAEVLLQKFNLPPAITCRFIPIS